MNGNDGNESLGIPEFLKRSDDKAPATVKSEVDMSEVIEQVPVTPKPRKPRKAISKGNGASKPAKAIKAAPKAKKAASKPAKGKAKAKKAASTAAVDQFGFRVGSLKAQAAAMYASKRGATLEEVKAKLKSVQLNLLTKLEGEGYKVSKVKEDGPGARQVTRYFLRAK